MFFRPSRLVLLGLWSLLLAAGLIAADLRVPQPPTPARQTWVRTADGWEKPAWNPARALEAPLPHPAVTGCFILLLSTLALLALPARKQPVLAKATYEPRQVAPTLH
jgi:hypothetical protein